MAEENKLPVAQQPRVMQVKNLCPGLMEMGKIKIGMKGDKRKSQGGGEYQLPQKIDHFIITTMERGDDNNFVRDEDMHKRFGDKPTEIPVRLLYDDPALNFPTRYCCYNGKTLCCSGDGETAMRLNNAGEERQKVSCLCDRQDPAYKGNNKCKINGILSTLIEGAEVVGGVWKFRTTSYNSVVGILSSLALIRRVTGGALAGIPLKMTVTPKTVVEPNTNSQQKIYVVGLHYEGSMEKLQERGYQIALDNAKHGVRIEHIEKEAMKILTYDGELMGNDETHEDIVAEYYPEEDMKEGDVETPDIVEASDEDNVVEEQEETPDLVEAATEEESTDAEIETGDLTADDIVGEESEAEECLPSDDDDPGPGDNSGEPDSPDTDDNSSKDDQKPIKLF